MSEKRISLIKKIQKVQDALPKDLNSEELVPIYLTPFELNLVRLGVKTLDAFESILEDEICK